MVWSTSNLETIGAKGYSSADPSISFSFRQPVSPWWRERHLNAYVAMRNNLGKMLRKFTFVANAGTIPPK